MVQISHLHLDEDLVPFSIVMDQKSQVQLVEFRELNIHSGILRGSGLTSQNKARYTILLSKCFSLTFNHSVQLNGHENWRGIMKTYHIYVFFTWAQKIYLGIHYLWILKVAFVRAFQWIHDILCIWNTSAMASWRIDNYHHIWMLTIPACLTGLFL